MSDLLAEVDEIMRRERMEKFWHENKTFIIAFISLTILMTGVFSAYRAWDNSVKTSQTSALINLMESAEYPDNMLEADLDFRSSIRGIALMGAAGTFMSQDKPEEAAQLYQKVLDDTKISTDFRHLAILTLTRINANKEGADASTLLAALEPVLKDSSPWQPEARMEAAVINAHLKKDFSAANALLNEVLETKDLPPTLYERAQSLHHVYELQATETKTNETPSQ